MARVPVVAALLVVVGVSAVPAVGILPGAWTVHVVAGVALRRRYFSATVLRMSVMVCHRFLVRRLPAA